VDGSIYVDLKKLIAKALQNIQFDPAANRRVDDRERWFVRPR